ncbi:hypothetical protein [Blastococcus sp. SYSU D00820]
MELEEVADELYEVPPEEFVAVRTERQQQARAEGDRALAKAIGALPKPSTAAWVCNLLVRAHREEIESLIELGDLLREAQDSLAGDQLRALNRQRSQLLSALTRQASVRARERGHAVSTAVAGQVEETLRAALADPEAGAALLEGRLTSPMSYSGLGGVTGISRPHLELVPEPPPRERRAPARAPRADPDRRAREEAERRAREEEARRAAEEQRRRELAEARAAVEEAEALAAEAEEAAEEERRSVAELDRRRTAARERVEELAAELERAEQAATDAATELKRAERRRATADRSARDAAAALERARERLAGLEDG